MNPVKMKINKACDLNSISVLPPHSRRSNTMSQASQIRSQSQQSFSQGTSLSQSQLSQSSFDENLMNDQDSEMSVRNVLCLIPSGAHLALDWLEEFTPSFSARLFIPSVDLDGMLTPYLRMKERILIPMLTSSV